MRSSAGTPGGRGCEGRGAWRRRKRWVTSRKPTTATTTAPARSMTPPICSPPSLFSRRNAGVTPDGPDPALVLVPPRTFPYRFGEGDGRLEAQDAAGLPGLAGPAGGQD